MDSRKILLTAQCYLHNAIVKHKIRVMFDPGSTISLVKRSLVKHAGLVGQKCILNLTVAGGDSVESAEEEVEIVLASLDGRYVSPSFTAVTKKNVVAPIPPVNLNPADFDELRGVKFTEDYPQHKETNVDLLLDIDVCLHMIGHTAEIPTAFGSPMVVLTKLGNVLGGAYHKQTIDAALYSVEADKKVDNLTDLVPDFQAFMKLEDLGVVERDSHLSKEDEEANELMKSLTSYDPIKKQYTTGLLWKKDPSTLLDSNYGAAKHITLSAKRKSIVHKKEEQVNAAYREQIEKGFAEKVPPKEEFPNHPTYCIPTHPVYRPDALTTKTRIVMNASSKCKSTGFSLNDCLYQGPTLLPDLVYILLLFRIYKYVTVCDISKMFWKIRINPPDSDCLRFLWQWAANEPVMLYRALSVTFGVISAPFQAIWTVLFHCTNFESQFPEAAAAIRQTLYMDDVSALDNDRDKAVQKVKQIYDLLLLASMQPHKWNSNSMSILKEAGIPEADWANVKMQKVLGMQWDTESDTIEFDFSKIIEQNGAVQTKRLLIQQAARIFDPCGLIAPFTLKAKLLFQECWKEKVEWDDPLPESIAEQWEEWRNEVQSLEKIVQQRLVGESDKSAWLAIFADASAFAYGACAYLVQSGNVKLIFAKTRVAPMKMPDKSGIRMTIARLELLASMVAVRVSKYLKKAFPAGFITGVKYFTDSLITLWRIRNGPAGYKVWVANRVAEIRNGSECDEWHFCPGQLNPADAASRSTGATELLENHLWWEGPAFLLKESDDWPTHKALSRQEALEQNEIDKLEQKKVEIAAVVTVSIVKPFMVMFNETSKWPRLVKKTCWIVKFLCYKCPSLKKKLSIYKYAPDEMGRCKQVSLPEYKASELLWLRWAQRKTLKDDIEIKDNELRVKEGGSLKQFMPYIDEQGLIRTSTRLSDSGTLPEETISPIILPRHDVVVEKFVLHLHVLHGHIGIGQALYFLRRQFRTCGGKREIKRILNLCAKPFCKKPIPIAQRLAPIPSIRIDDYQAWRRVSCDLMGPFVVKHVCVIEEGDEFSIKPKKSKRSKKKVVKETCPHPKTTKAWGCLFTCLQTRAVHVELVADMSTTTFLRAFSRMCARRGVPDYIWSDNAASFKSADRTLRQLYKQIDWNEVHNKGVVKNIEWRFGTELAPHSNGVVERMVQSVKTALKTTFRNSGVPFRQLETIMIEAEAIVNDRPLVAQSEDESAQHTITPSQLCIGRCVTTLPLDQKVEQKAHTDYTRMQMYRKELILKFWKRWKHEYLLGQQALMFAGKGKVPLEAGQIVLLKEDNIAKGRWKFARVLETITGRDGLIRRVKLRTAQGVVDRHINFVALLEGGATKEQQDKLLN